MKNLTTWVGGLVSILLLAGCSSNSNPNPTSSEAQTVEPAIVSQPKPDTSTVTKKPPTEEPEKRRPEVEKKLTDPYELTHFKGAFKSYKALDKVPKLYRTEQYNIKKWQLRKLPSPAEGSHWTYFGGAYVEITDSDGVIGRIYSGDNIYR